MTTVWYGIHAHELPFIDAVTPNMPALLHWANIKAIPSPNKRYKMPSSSDSKIIKEALCVIFLFCLLPFY